MEKYCPKIENLEHIVGGKLEGIPKKCGKVVVIQRWEESEEGWGTRPDGFSLHLNLDDCRLFIKEYWDGMPDEVQSEYSRPCGTPYLGMVDEKIFARIEESENGIRTYEDVILPG